MLVFPCTLICTHTSTCTLISHATGIHLSPAGRYSEDIMFIRGPCQKPLLYLHSCSHIYIYSLNHNRLITFYTQQPDKPPSFAPPPFPSPATVTFPGHPMVEVDLPRPLLQPGHGSRYHWRRWRRRRSPGPGASFVRSSQEAIIQRCWRVGP